jgi:hypothetical protein
MSSSFDICRVRHCPRSCNKVAHYLAKYGRSVVSSGSVVFSSQVPTFVENLVSGELEMVSNGNKLSEIKEKNSTTLKALSHHRCPSPPPPLPHPLVFPVRRPPPPCVVLHNTSLICPPISECRRSAPSSALVGYRSTSQTLSPPQRDPRGRGSKEDEGKAVEKLIWRWKVLHGDK